MAISPPIVVVLGVLVMVVVDTLGVLVMVVVLTDEGLVHTGGSAIGEMPGMSHVPSRDLRELW